MQKKLYTASTMFFSLATLLLPGCAEFTPAVQKAVDSLGGGRIPTEITDPLVATIMNKLQEEWSESQGDTVETKKVDLPQDRSPLTTGPLNIRVDEGAVIPEDRRVRFGSTVELPLTWSMSGEVTDSQELSVCRSDLLYYIEDSGKSLKVKEVVSVCGLEADRARYHKSYFTVPENVPEGKYQIVSTLTLKSKGKIRNIDEEVFPFQDFLVSESGGTYPSGGALSQESNFTNGSGNTYIVQSGDTLGEIAAKFNVSIDAIANHNNIRNVNNLHEGQQLEIPSR